MFRHIPTRVKFIYLGSVSLAHSLPFEYQSHPFALNFCIHSLINLRMFSDVMLFFNICKNFVDCIDVVTCFPGVYAH